MLHQALIFLCFALLTWAFWVPTSAAPSFASSHFPHSQLAPALQGQAGDGRRGLLTDSDLSGRNVHCVRPVVEVHGFLQAVRLSLCQHPSSSHLPWWRHQVHTSPSPTRLALLPSSILLLSSCMWQGPCPPNSSSPTSSQSLGRWPALLCCPVQPLLPVPPLPRLTEGSLPCRPHTGHLLVHPNSCSQPCWAGVPMYLLLLLTSTPGGWVCPLHPFCAHSDTLH